MSKYDEIGQNKAGSNVAPPPLLQNFELSLGSGMIGLTFPHFSCRIHYKDIDSGFMQLGAVWVTLFLTLVP